MPQNFCEITTLDLSYVCCDSQIYGGDFAKFCGLLRIYELYPKAYFRLEFLTANFGFVKTMRKIFLNFVGFSESPNFN